MNAVEPQTVTQPAAAQVREGDPWRVRLDSEFAAQRRRALVLRESTLAQRLERLERLRRAVEGARQEIAQAAHADFHKPQLEVALGEILPVVSSIKFAQKNLKRWMRPRKVSKPANMIGVRCELHYEPKGTSLIIAPWNYPVFLTLVPLAAALAAGCTAILKPSEMTPHLSALLERLIRDTFDPADVTLFQGDAEVAEALLALPFDHIFYTGNPTVGKKVMAAAARNLASVTLELGGKSPVIVDRDADIPSAARRIAWGKFLNCGQTCVAPDHVWVHRSQRAALQQALAGLIARSYGGDPETVALNPDYARIVNGRHTRRLQALLEDALSRGAQVVAGGEVRPDECYVAPTLLAGVPTAAAIMQEEIFGPLLPMLEFDQLDEVLTHINAAPKPLALYVFSQSPEVVKRVLGQTSAGGVAVNNVMIHGLNPYLPFGGVNNSGIGKSNGEFGFREFSNEKAVAIQRSRFSPLQLFTPPYTGRMGKLTDIMIRYFA